MSLKTPSVKLENAKRVISLPNFKQNNLLKIALTDLSTLQLLHISEEKREAIEYHYRRMSYLGDKLLDAALAEYLFETDMDFFEEDLDHWHKEITSRSSLAVFAMALQWPDLCSSWNQPNRKSPSEESEVYGEMMKVLIAAVYLEGDRDFKHLYQWLCDNYIKDTIENILEDAALEDGEDNMVTTREYLDIIGLEEYSEDGWIPGDDD